MKSNTTPNHDNGSRTSVAMHNVTVQQSLTTVSPNSNPTIVMQAEEAQRAPVMCVCAIMLNDLHVSSPSTHSEDGPRVIRIPASYNIVLNAVRRNPSTSVRAVATAVGGSRSSVHRVLQHENLHP
ncbi:hypothetical protein TNCV_2391051 [Trichonephila clavipes]|nr:hypothetical protein TNCV_2391051 [Trichonephila clavipes]